jgi:hypothetical protein
MKTAPVRSATPSFFHGVLHRVTAQDRPLVGPRRLDLAAGTLRHDHGRNGLEHARRERHALRVVARAGGHYAMGALCVSQPGEPDVPAADLERAGSLQVLGLQVDRPADQLRENPRVQHRRRGDHVPQDLARGDHVIRGRYLGNHRHG